MPQQPPNIDNIFLAALERPTAAERAAYLHQACGADVELRLRVERLLQAQPDVGSFLESPAPELVPTLTERSLTEAPGTIIGPYRLLEQIGEGGFGVVFMAEQTAPVKRKVAVKVIKPGMDTRQVIARFEAERQALALMDHSNIARVLDAGATETGRPFFVMELVKGVPITHFCDEHQLSPRERLELFVTVCQAVQHAHQKGIIHRDIKPTNVLVTLHDDRAVVKVIDFGIAKATSGQLTDKTLFTGFAQLVGTPLYMSPEQASLSGIDVDTRSDIYSLGVLLYELLTGTTPFDRTRLQEAAFDEVRRIIREEEPQKPSTRLSSLGETLPSVSAVRKMEPSRLTRLVRGDLDWIVMKALEKERSRRYETANGFAADVLRYLNDEPVLACPPSAAYRMRKFARRNKAGLAVAALVLFFLVSLGTAIGWSVRDREAREREFAHERATREQQAAREKTERETRLTSHVELILEDVRRLEQEQKWPEALAAAQRAQAVAAGGEVAPDVDAQVRQALGDLEILQRLEQIRVERVTLLNGSFDYGKADREYALAFRQYGLKVDESAAGTSIRRPDVRPALVVPLAAALDDWGFVRRMLPEGDGADWKRQVAIAREIDPEPLRDRLRSSWGRPERDMQEELRGLAESIDVRAHAPATIGSLARTVQAAGHPESALRLLRQAQYAYPDDFWLNFDLAIALSQQKDHAGAIRYLTAAVCLRPNAAAAHNNLGLVLHHQRKLDEAIACYRRAIEIDPALAPLHFHLGPAYASLGNALRGQGKHEEALDAYGQALEFSDRLIRNPRLLARTQRELYALLHAAERRPEAEQLYRQARAGWERYAANQRPHSRWELAWFLVTWPDPRFRDPPRALELAGQIVEEAPEVSYYWRTLGAAQLQTGDAPAAIAALENANERASGGGAWEWFFLAMAHWQHGNEGEAHHWYDRAVQHLEQCRDHTDIGEIVQFRAEAAELLGITEQPGTDAAATRPVED